MNIPTPVLSIFIVAAAHLCVPTFSPYLHAEEGTFAYPLPDESASSWREPKSCGPNALYCMLRLNDIDVTLDRVLREAPPGERGVSLLSLEQASNRLGMQTAVVFVDNTGDLSRLPFPMIAHLSAARDGHFVLMLGIDEPNGELIVADAVSCEVKRQTLDEFAQLWSGYLLVHETALVGWWVDRLLITGCGLCLVVLIAGCVLGLHGITREG